MLESSLLLPESKESLRREIVRAFKAALDFLSCGFSTMLLRTSPKWQRSSKPWGRFLVVLISRHRNGVKLMIDVSSTGSDSVDGVEVESGCSAVDTGDIGAEILYLDWYPISMW